MEPITQLMDFVKISRYINRMEFRNIAHMLWVVDMSVAVLTEFSRLSFKMLEKLMESEHMHASATIDFL